MLALDSRQNSFTVQEYMNRSMSKKTEAHISLLGLRHLALRVTDMEQSRGFYEGLLGMTVVWQPDPGSLYLTSGCDNLALHALPPEDRNEPPLGKGRGMDHLGFIVESPAAVLALEKRMREAGVPIVKPYKPHRDGSHSFYMMDPDGNVIQILFELKISPMKFVESGGDS